MPLTDDTPKPLVKVNGEPIIERQIKYLKEIGISEIIIVTGYLHEQFNYLVDKYGVKLILNEKYDIYNNIYSMYLAKEYLENSFVLDGDVYLTNNFLNPNLKHSAYFSGIKENFHDEWILNSNSNNDLIEISIGKGTDYIMSGVSFWVKEDTEKIKIKTKQLVETDKFQNLFWDNIIKDNIQDFSIKINKIQSTDWFEIDSMTDFKEAEKFINPIE